MSDILTTIGTIIAIIGGVIAIIAFIMKIKWKALCPRWRLKAKLKKYREVRFGEQRERRKTNEIISLLFKAQRRFEQKGFIYDINPQRHGNINYEGFTIHLTPPGRSLPLNLFKISNNLNEAYYSEGYPEQQRINNNIGVLDNLIQSI